VRRRAKGKDGVVRCQRCGSEEGPFDVHHSSEAYRHLGEELDHLDLMRYGAVNATSSGMGTGPIRWFRRPGKNWKSGSGGFLAEHVWMAFYSEWNRLLTVLLGIRVDC
jgi:hypothetical protein